MLLRIVRQHSSVLNDLGLSLIVCYRTSITMHESCTSRIAVGEIPGTVPQYRRIGPLCSEKVLHSIEVCIVIHVAKSWTMSACQPVNKNERYSV